MQAAPAAVAAAAAVAVSSSSVCVKEQRSLAAQSMEMGRLCTTVQREKQRELSTLTQRGARAAVMMGGDLGSSTGKEREANNEEKGLLGAALHEAHSLCSHTRTHIHTYSAHARYIVLVLRTSSSRERGGGSSPVRGVERHRDMEERANYSCRHYFPMQFSFHFFSLPPSS